MSVLDLFPTATTKYLGEKKAACGLKALFWFLTRGSNAVREGLAGTTGEWCPHQEL